MLIFVCLLLSFYKILIVYFSSAHMFYSRSARSPFKPGPSEGIKILRYRPHYGLQWRRVNRRGGLWWRKITCSRVYNTLISYTFLLIFTSDYDGSECSGDDTMFSSFSPFFEFFLVLFYKRHWKCWRVVFDRAWLTLFLVCDLLLAELITAASSRTLVVCSLTMI